MNPTIEKSIKICIAALNSTPAEDADAESADTHPDNRPDDRFVLATLEQLSKEPYHGRGLGIGEVGANNYRSSWQDMAQRFVGRADGIRSILSWKNALLMLFDWANLDEKEMLRHADALAYDKELKSNTTHIIYNHILKHIIENLVRLDDIARAKEYTLHFRPTRIFKEKDNRQEGYRIIARYYANRGDTENFFKLYKLCNPSDEKHEMELLKMDLVKGVTRHHGIDAAIELCAHKNIGERYYYHALSVPAEAGEYDKLKQLFAARPQLKQPEQETELKILIEAIKEARDKGREAADDFEQLLERAKNVSPKLRWGDDKLRDSLLFDLGLAWRANPERLALCRKAIKNNWLKKELKDTTPPATTTRPPKSVS